MKLYRLIECADFVSVNGYDIDEFAYGDELRLTCDDDNSWTFDDQEITAIVDGNIEAMTDDGDCVVITLTMLRRMTVEDYIDLVKV